MELEKAITTRRSIRGFKPAPVPKKLLLEILDIARWAPSGRNYQPWEIAVVGGPVLDELKRAINERVTTAVESYPDVPRLASLPEIYEKRRWQNWEKMRGSWVLLVLCYSQRVACCALTPGPWFWGNQATDFVCKEIHELRWK